MLLVVDVAVGAGPPGYRPLLDHGHHVAVPVQRMLPPLARERELLGLGVRLAYRLADHIPVPRIPDLHDVVVAHHPLVRHHDLPAVGKVDDAVVHCLGQRLTVVGVAPEQLVGDGNGKLVHEQAHLDDRLGPVLLAGPLGPEPVLVIRLVPLEVVVGDVVEHHRVPSAELLLHLGVQVPQQVGPPLQQAVHAPVDVLKAVARVAEEPPLVLPGALLGGRPQASRVEQVLEDDVDVELAVQVPAPVVDELVQLQAVVQPRVGGEPEVPAVVRNPEVSFPGQAEPEAEVDLVVHRPDDLPGHLAQLVGPSVHIGLRVLFSEAPQRVGGVFLDHDRLALALLSGNAADAVDVVDGIAALEHVPGDCVGHGVSPCCQYT
ncbi:hypothetical protein SDC9_118839 [bioreactor metagenome]|uniref:Uncharacterized protein n=1 Tax=bioreactor metagenome TaxID=1076179 RepID=A0A645C3D2_9ZZZZ